MIKDLLTIRSKVVSAAVARRSTFAIQAFANFLCIGVMTVVRNILGIAIYLDAEFPT